MLEKTRRRSIVEWMCLQGRSVDIHETMLGGLSMSALGKENGKGDLCGHMAGGLSTLAFRRDPFLYETLGVLARAAAGVSLLHLHLQADSSLTQVPRQRH